MSDKVIKCETNGQKHCSSMAERLQTQGSKGLVVFTLFNHVKGTNRLVLGYKESVKDRGIVLNFCPFCGTEYKFEGLNYD